LPSFAFNRVICSDPQTACDKIKNTNIPYFSRD
jgi:hypothetical protein